MLLPDALREARTSLLGAASRLGLSSGLQLCLDAGAAASYDPGVSTDKWFDLSGNGCDFYRGSGTGSDSADPIFNGSAGRLSASEYFASDGGDYFTYDSANETWMTNLHKDNAAFSACFWIYRAVSAANWGFFGTRGTASGNTGVIFNVTTASDILQFVCSNAGASALSVNGTASLSAGAWHFVGLIVDEAAGGTASKLYLDGAVESFNGTYSSPSSGTATATLQLGSRGNGNQPIENGGRIAACAFWSAVKTTADFDALFAVTRGRFGI